MKTFYLIAGTKGGIGKTFIATLLADMALQSGKKVVLYDCDDENHTLEESYPVKIENRNVVGYQILQGSFVCDNNYTIVFIYPSGIFRFCFIYI